MKRALWVGVLFVLASAAGCSRVSERKLASERPDAPALKEATAKSESPQKGPLSAPGDSSSSAPDSSEYLRKAEGRLVAIGDLHGDFDATQKVFRLVGATDDKDHWSGGTLTVVQTGDQLDRGDGERAILDFLERLALEAKQAGGLLIVLNGNHETMNALGDFRYVTAGALHSFDGPSEDNRAQMFPTAARGRASAFLPGGPWAKKLAERPVIVQVNDVLFAHAGVRAPHVDYGIDRLNRETSAWLRGDLQNPPRLITDEEGPVWTRVYGAPNLDEKACDVLSRALERARASRMVVGHTVQQGGVTGACRDRVYRIDVGMSSYYGGTQIQALEILPDSVRVLTGSR